MMPEVASLNAARLAEILGRPVEAVAEISRIGTGQMSRNFRLRLVGSSVPSIVVKVPAEEAATRELGAGAYQREVFFYADVAPQLDAGLAACHHHEISDDGTDFLLVLDDLAPAEQGDQLTGCSVPDAERALENLAAIHAAGWQNDRLLSGRTFDRSGESLLDTIYPMACDEFLRRYADRLAPGTERILEAFRACAARWSAYRPEPQSIVHGDYRLDNLLFTPEGVVAVDWQTVSAGPPARDVAYFLGNSLTIEDRRANEDRLLDRYRRELASRGIEMADEELRDAYALGAWLGPLVTVVGAFVATRTDRGDDMFIAMADRAGAQLQDHDGIARLDALS